MGTLVSHGVELTTLFDEQSLPAAQVHFPHPGEEEHGKHMAEHPPGSGRHPLTLHPSPGPTGLPHSFNLLSTGSR